MEAMKLMQTTKLCYFFRTLFNNPFLHIIFLIDHVYQEVQKEHSDKKASQCVKILEEQVMILLKYVTNSNFVVANTLKLAC